MENIAINEVKPVINGSTFSRSVEKTRRRVKAAVVVNSLNRINFQGEKVFVRLRHVSSNSFKTVAAQAKPTNGTGVQLTWDEAARTLFEDISAYEYFGFFYIDGMKMVWVRAVLILMDHNGITLEKPEGGDEVNERNCRRFKCLGMPTTLTQGIINLQGMIKDCSATALAIKVIGDQDGVARKINFDKSVNITLANGEVVLLEATCRTIRASASGPETTIVLQPEKSIKTDNFSTISEKLTPQPCIEFMHPFLAKKISLKVVDISGAGISVEENPASSLLIPGMVIPDMAITFANNFKIYCRSQVTSNRHEKGRNTAYSDLSFTEMDCENQVQLASILFQAKNERSYLGTVVDQDELWDFFFETGFVYPKKYGAMAEQKVRFKALYSQLYNGCPDIARHVIYRDRGVIYGHLSMLRYYRRTWLIHHHAAVKSSEHKAGLVVLEHLVQHINEVHHLPDAAMEYLACYFRPNNRFANRMFGDGLRSMHDLQKASLDEFAYFHHDPCWAQELPDDWVITRTSSEDLMSFKAFYDEISGGLMLVGLDLEDEFCDDEKINSTYKEKGLLRERKLRSLKDKDGRVVAIFVLNFSDVGLNMSSLTDCIQVMVVDHDKAVSDKILSALDIVSEDFEGKAPVLMFPKSYADENGFAYENIYTLGVMDSNYIFEFIKYLDELTSQSLRLARKRARKTS